MRGGCVGSGIPKLAYSSSTSSYSGCASAVSRTIVPRQSRQECRPSTPTQSLLEPVCPAPHTMGATHGYSASQPACQSLLVPVCPDHTHTGRHSWVQCLAICLQSPHTSAFATPDLHQRSAQAPLCHESLVKRPTGLPLRLVHLVYHSTLCAARSSISSTKACTARSSFSITKLFRMHRNVLKRADWLQGCSRK